MRTLLLNNAVSKRLCQTNTASELFKMKWKKPHGHETGFHVYNNLAKKLVPLVTERQNILKWYSCGPTVYEHSHIGHAFSYIRFDIIRRFLENQGFSVIYALNITDIDDKIIAKSLQLKREAVDVAREFEASFFEDLDCLNVLRPSLTLRVTENIPAIIDFIRRLESSGHAYQTNDGIWFDTAKDVDYPRFRFNESETANESTSKRNHADFSLWKAAKPGEPFWDSPFGNGRPGWHIECSAMASKVFGASIDVHSGGKDLEFPHHENEEAQSCAFHSCENWAKYYLHSGHIKFGDKKMSKSIGNVVSIRTFLESGSADELRLMCLRFSYRADIDYNDELRSSVANSLDRIKTVLKDSEEFLQGRFPVEINEEQLLQNLFLTQLKVGESLKNDFDFSKAFLAVWELICCLGTQLDDSDHSNSSGFMAVAATKNYVESFLRIAGFKLAGASSDLQHGKLTSTILDSSVDFRCEVRKSALSIKDSPEGKQLLALSDNFRNELQNAGVTIKDKNNRSLWTLTK